MTKQTSDGSQMGRRHPDFTDDSERPALLARIFCLIEEAHPGGHVGVFIDIFGSKRIAAPAKAQYQRTMMQKWRRWTSGASVPARSEVNRILAIAERKGWLQSTGLELDLSALKASLIDNTPSSDAKRAGWKRRKDMKTWAADLCKSDTTTEEAAWASRLRFVRPCVDDLIEAVDERLGGPGSTAPRQASLAEPATPMEALAMFRATMVEVACQMIEAMDCHPLVMATSKSEDENDPAAVTSLSTEREVEDGPPFEGSDPWAELLSKVGTTSACSFVPHRTKSVPRATRTKQRCLQELASMLCRSSTAIPRKWARLAAFIRQRSPPFRANLARIWQQTEKPALGRLVIPANLLI